jgi:hemoglobin
MRESTNSLRSPLPSGEAFLDDFRQTLNKFGVPEAEQVELNAIVASTPGNIVI